MERARGTRTGIFRACDCAGIQATPRSPRLPRCIRFSASFWFDVSFPRACVISECTRAAFVARGGSKRK
eukprot:1187982-Prymnesium_polylepis.1